MLQKCYEYLCNECINTYMSHLVARSAIVKSGHQIVHCRNWSRVATPSRAPPSRYPVAYMRAGRLEKAGQAGS